MKPREEVCPVLHEELVEVLKSPTLLDPSHVHSLQRCAELEAAVAEKDQRIAELEKVRFLIFHFLLRVDCFR